MVGSAPKLLPNHSFKILIVQKYAQCQIGTNNLFDYKLTHFSYTRETYQSGLRNT